MPTTSIETTPIIYPCLSYRDADAAMTNQAGVDARQTGPRALGHALVAVLETGQPFLDVDVVREFDRLNRLRLHPEEIIHRRAKRRACRREDG